MVKEESRTGVGVAGGDDMPKQEDAKGQLPAGKDGTWVFCLFVLLVSHIGPVHLLTYANICR